MSGTGAPRVAVIGAGIVGCCIALELQRRGAEVTLIDRGEPGMGCSYGNSGALSPGSVAPLAMPGVLASVPGMLLDSRSPLYLPLGYLPTALPWLMRFVASATPARVAQAAQRLHDVHAGAIERHVALAHEVGVPELVLRQGHLHLYPDQAALDGDAAGWRLRRQYGHDHETLDRAGIVALEPRVAERYRVAVLQRDHATILNPLRYVQAIARTYIARGGRLIRGEARGLRPEGSRWRIDLGSQGSSNETHASADEFHEQVVIATGAWSRRLTDPLGIRLHLESQRGYHLQYEGARDLVSRTVVLADRKVFVTPMEQGLRVGGTVEIGGLDRPPDWRRAESLRRIMRESFTDFVEPACAEWMGHRPCMPDSVPVVGPVDEHPGLWLAVGHGHLGVTDSVNTSISLVTALLQGAPLATFPVTSTH